MSQRVKITSPVGRIVMGNLYQGSTTDAEGKPLVVKTGANAGQPRVNYWFALAIAKSGERHWAETAWGSKIWQVGHAAFPQAAQSPTFAWKIEDGDSQIPNRKGRKPCENEGFPGHWVIKFSGSYAPAIYRDSGNGRDWVQEMTPDYVKPGYFVEVAFEVEGNGSAQQSGVYLNPRMVAFRAYGPEIVFGMDPSEAGFGQAALPAGASMVPPAGAPMPAATPTVPGAPGAVPGMPAIPGVTQPIPGVPGAPGAAAGVPAIPGATPPIPGAVPPAGVAPNPAFLQVPGGVPAAPPVVPVAPPVAPVRRMLPASNGATYEQMIEKGWTDALLIAHQMMAP